MYSDDQVDRCAQLGGEFAKHLQEMFLRNVAASKCPNASRSKHVCPDVQRFLDEYTDDRLWDYKPGRRHDGFKDVRVQFGISNTAKFASTVARLSNTLSVWENFLHKE